MKNTHETHLRRLIVMLAALLLACGASVTACEDDDEAFDETRADQTYGIEREGEQPLVTGQVEQTAERIEQRLPAEQPEGLVIVPPQPAEPVPEAVVVIPQEGSAQQQAPMGEQQAGLQPERIGVDANLASICQVADLDQPTKTYFDFDSAQLTADARQKLDAIAQCLTEGALSEREVELQLIGSADPRGGRLYNEHLGLQRAQSVADYLEAQGVKVRRVNSWSVGQLDVEKEKRFDNARRVEIRLVTS